MIHALTRYPKSQRSAVAREWAKRSNAVQSEARIERGIDAETERHRTLHDMRGQVLREGVCYKNGNEMHWQVRRSVSGKSSQLTLSAMGE